MFGPDFFRHNIPPIHLNLAKEITVNDIYENGNLKQLDVINNNLPVQLSLASYMRIAGTVQFWNKKMLVSTGNNIGKSLIGFLSHFKKGSKPFRNILGTTRTQNEKKIGIKSLSSFFSVRDVQPDPDPEFLKLGILECWNFHFLNNRLREFLYKYVSNRINTNNKLAHFCANVNAGCTFCTLEKRIPVPIETLQHIFFYCPSTAQILAMADRQFWPEFNFHLTDRKTFWLGLITRGIDNSDGLNFFALIVAGTVLSYIWECKIKKQRMSWSGCKEAVTEVIKNSCKVSSKFISIKADGNCSLSRRG
jgi:hypothetical protein